MDYLKAQMIESAQKEGEDFWSVQGLMGIRLGKKTLTIFTPPFKGHDVLTCSDLQAHPEGNHVLGYQWKVF